MSAFNRKKLISTKSKVGLLLIFTLAISCCSIYLDDVSERSEFYKVGVAPLSVHFSASLKESDATTRVFHEQDYTWDFGDDETAVWKTSGRLKNTAKGAVATHIFEHPGYYTVTLTIRNETGFVESKTYKVNVLDSDDFYAGENTIVVSNSNKTDFSGAPKGSLRIMTDNLREVTQYVSAGKRLLLARGSEWKTNGLNFHGNSGPVTLGAFGVGPKPKISIMKGSFINLNGKQNWRIMDLSFTNVEHNAKVVEGATDIQRSLLLRLDSTGFTTPISISHYNGRERLPISEIVIAESNFTNFTGLGIYVGAERLALLGNVVQNIGTQHTVRIWQSYMGVIQHNVFSRAKYTSNGQHVMKLHGPEESLISSWASSSSRELRYRSKFVIVSDNIFLGQGPWSVAIGPQNSIKDERLSDLIFERNRIIAQYDELQSFDVRASLRLAGRYFSIRNNLIDGTGAYKNYSGIVLAQRGTEPPPTGVVIYNNTIFRADNNDSENNNVRRGIRIGKNVTDSQVINNIISFPNSVSTVDILDNQSAGLIVAKNIQVDSSEFAHVNSKDPLARNFRLAPNARSINQAQDIQLFDDFYGLPRNKPRKDIGAVSYP